MKSVLFALVAVAIMATGSLTEAKPSTPVEGCRETVVVPVGVYKGCFDFAEAHHTTFEKLLLWNTGLGKDCQNLDVGEKICISGPQETKGSNSGKADIAAAAPAPRTANTATTGSTAGNTKPQVKGTTRPLYPNMMTKPAAATAAADGAGALKKQQSGQPTTNKLTNANSGGAKAESVRPAASAGPSPQHGSA